MYALQIPRLSSQGLPVLFQSSSFLVLFLSASTLHLSYLQEFCAIPLPHYNSKESGFYRVSTISLSEVSHKTKQLQPTLSLYTHYNHQQSQISTNFCHGYQLAQCLLAYPRRLLGHSFIKTSGAPSTCPPVSLAKTYSRKEWESSPSTQHYDTEFPALLAPLSISLKI